MSDISSAPETSKNTDAVRSIAPASVVNDPAPPTIAVPEWLFVRAVDTLTAVLAGAPVTESHREVLPALEQLAFSAKIG